SPIAAADLPTPVGPTIKPTRIARAEAASFAGEAASSSIAACGSLSLSERALHNCGDPLWPLSLSEERVRERSDGCFTTSIRSDCGTAKFRLPSPAARDIRADLSLVKERLEKRRCDSHKISYLRNIRSIRPRPHWICTGRPCG